MKCGVIYVLRHFQQWRLTKGKSTIFLKTILNLAFFPSVFSKTPSSFNFFLSFFSIVSNHVTKGTNHSVNNGVVQTTHSRQQARIAFWRTAKKVHADETKHSVSQKHLFILYSKRPFTSDFSPLQYICLVRKS